MPKQKPQSHSQRRQSTHREPVREDKGRAARRRVKRSVLVDVVKNRKRAAGRAGQEAVKQVRQSAPDVRVNEIHIVPAFHPLWDESKRRYFCWSGRYSGKSRSIALNRVMMSTSRQLKGVCARWEKEATKASQREEIVAAIEQLGLSAYWNRTDTKNLKCNLTGSEIQFVGLEGKGGHRSMSDIDWAWMEEAHQFKIAKDFHDFLSTVIRKKGCKIFVSGNKEREDDPAYVWCMGYLGDKETVFIENDCRDNDYLGPEAKEHIATIKRTDYDRYCHEILGHFLKHDESAVIPADWLACCFELWEKFGHQLPNFQHRREFGADPADGGDKYMLAGRAGPFLEHIQDLVVRTKGRVLETTGRVDRIVVAARGKRLNYDVTGKVGNQAASYFKVRSRRPYRVFPVSFDMKIAGEKTLYDGVSENKALFHGHSTQMAWNIRDRAANSFLLAGDGVKEADVRMTECLIIDPSCCDRESRRGNVKEGLVSKAEFVRQMTQPVYTVRGGKYHVDKDPHGRGSPDIFDGVRLAYRSDIDSGLRSLR